MSATNTGIIPEKAPCGQVVAGEHYREEDEEGLITDHVHYACGCRIIRHEYHDGSMCRKVVRHDGTVLSDELMAESWH